MPLYVYACPCGRRETLLLSASKRDEPVRCPECQRQMEPVIAPAAIPPSGTYSYAGR